MGLPAEPRTAASRAAGGTDRARRAVAVAAVLVCSASSFSIGTGLSPVPAVAWLAPLAVLLLAPRVTAGWSAAVAFAAYLAGTAGSWDYLLRPRPSLAIPLPAALSIIVGGSALFALTTLLFRALVVRGLVTLAAFAAPAAWVSGLYLASLASPSGVLGPLATSQADVTTVVQIASVTGAWGVEYLVLFASSALAALFAPGWTPSAVALYAPRVPWAVRLRAGAAAAGVLALALGYGVLRLQGAPGTGSPQDVAVVARAGGHWGVDVSTREGESLLRAYADRIAALPAGVRLVVLPEAAFAADDASLASLVGPMARVARSKGTAIVAGLLHTTAEGRYNSALAIPADGGAPVEYHKWNAGPGEALRPGHDLVFLPGGSRVALEVCADVNVPAPTRDYAAAGAALLAVPASDEDVDGWQHSRTALLRGVEHGLATAWSGQRGTLMIADGRGRVLAEDVTARRRDFAVASARVAPGPGATLYTRLGDAFAWLCLVIVLTGLVLVRRTRAPRPGRAAAAVGMPGRREAARPAPNSAME
ncbi:nitrilase-related carbon-nitrogen hydrolase [Microbispora sp. H13382]|uniref:nitrilase-related carbon-nitrogen hydrolase n=1 Tax=Microbispora sp. H13382 TaxID=2729112 RepID=UPI001600F1F6|nr:nitrilase-related carbon-nitrogen hydrolase [Microbispora sp. H13382]